ncbi:hypothetical protein EVAR_83701_1 [Eumeta japonica]|uniref:Uncharacterized protein n=1 Tax=Eumeta variegata TaxID=151549 RepID=A0A4C1WAU3_EUMVA|nr:hypothetical protein EVAR_83701_1 [Eumeta japonica]
MVDNKDANTKVQSSSKREKPNLPVCNQQVRFTKIQVQKEKPKLSVQNQHKRIRKVMNTKIELKALCRCGINLLYLWVLNDINFISRLSYHEGFYQSFVSSCREMKGDLKLNEMQTVLLAGLEDTLPIVADNVQAPSAAACDIWIHGFENFNLTEYHS